MALCSIELNDSEIRVAHNTDIILRSPGYAVIREQGVELGEAAAKLAHLHPRASNNRYWNKLNQDALQSSSTQVRHNADLAYAHLLALHEQAGRPAEMLFVVPGSYSRQQLSLLLGLVEACPFKAIGLVDSAVAAGAQTAGHGSYAHLDIHLHQAILTELNVADAVSKTAVQMIDDAGLATIYDACAAMMADLFIRHSRFDPQHHAETEQALYDQIPPCLEKLSSNSEVLLEIAYQGTQHQARLSRAALLDRLKQYYQKILAAIPADADCLISDRLARLPGFVEQQAGMRVLEPTGIFKTCVEQLELIRSSGPALSLITRLPTTSNPAIRETITDEKAAPAAKAEMPATHILNGHQAHPLGAQALFLSASNNPAKEKAKDCPCSVFVEEGQAILQSDSPGVLVNGEKPAQRTRIKAGDVLRLARSRVDYLFINVAGREGAR